MVIFMSLGSSLFCVLTGVLYSNHTYKSGAELLLLVTFLLVGEVCIVQCYLSRFVLYGTVRSFTTTSLQAELQKDRYCGNHGTNLVLDFLGPEPDTGFSNH